MQSIPFPSYAASQVVQPIATSPRVKSPQDQRNAYYSRVFGLMAVGQKDDKENSPNRVLAKSVSEVSLNRVSRCPRGCHSAGCSCLDVTFPPYEPHPFPDDQPNEVNEDCAEAMTDSITDVGKILPAEDMETPNKCVNKEDEPMREETTAQAVEVKGDSPQPATAAIPEEPPANEAARLLTGPAPRDDILPSEQHLILDGSSKTSTSATQTNANANGGLDDPSHDHSNVLQQLDYLEMQIRNAETLCESYATLRLAMHSLSSTSTVSSEALDGSMQPQIDDAQRALTQLKTDRDALQHSLGLSYIPTSTIPEEAVVQRAGDYTFPSRQPEDAIYTSATATITDNAPLYTVAQSSDTVLTATQGQTSFLPIAMQSSDHEVLEWSEQTAGGGDVQITGVPLAPNGGEMPPLQDIETLQQLLNRSNGGAKAIISAWQSTAAGHVGIESQISALYKSMEAEEEEEHTPPVRTTSVDRVDINESLQTRLQIGDRGVGHSGSPRKNMTFGSAENNTHRASGDAEAACSELVAAVCGGVEDTPCTETEFLGLLGRVFSVFRSQQRQIEELRQENDELHRRLDETSDRTPLRRSVSFRSRDDTAASPQHVTPSVTPCPQRPAAPHHQHHTDHSCGGDENQQHSGVNNSKKKRQHCCGRHADSTPTTSPSAVATPPSKSPKQGKRAAKKRP